MIKNYIKTAWRNTTGSVSFSIVNILGLAAGLCSFVVILLYLNYELSYDSWSPELNRVYKVSLKQNEDFLQTTPAPLAGFIAQKYPNAEAATCLQSDGDFEILLASGEKKLYQKDIVTVDSSFFRVFPYKLIRGDVATVLNNPKAVVLTEELSKKLFGNVDPIGKPLKVFNFINCVVTGIMQQPNGPVAMPVAMLMRDPYGKQNNSWGNYSFNTYIKLKHPESDATIEAAINRFYYNERLKKSGVSFEAYQKAGAKTALFVDALPRIHNFPKHAASNFKTVSVLLILAVLLLLAGSINFSNMAIATSISRAKEVGIRKVLGSGRRQLVFQFMMETGLQCLVSLIIAMLLLNLALPYINHTFNISLVFWQQNSAWSIIWQIAACLVFVILLSGFYPSVYLSRFNAVKVLKGNYSSGKKGTLFRNSLIVVQFMVAVFFISGIIVIKSQLNFMEGKDKGFSGDQVVRIQATQPTSEQNFANTRNILLGVPGVSYVSKTTKVPGDHLFVDTSTIGFNYQGKPYRMSSVKVSTDYFKTLNIGLKQGRYFTDDPADQNTRTAVINESAARKLNLPDPIGKMVSFPGCDSIPLQIVGVVKDFNVSGFESEVQPVVFTIGQKACMFQSGGAVLVKLNGNHVQQSIDGITEAWKKIEPAFPVRYSFVDDNFSQLFVSYNRLQQIITFFGIIAITISVSGLFAITVFFTRQRTKEIGVRKVLGASVAQLSVLLGREFVYLVLLSIAIVSPVAWWAMQKWLQTFAYRIPISWWMFVVAGSVAIITTVVTVSYHAIRAAMANPVKSLRSE